MSLGLPSNLSEIPSPQAGPTTLSAKPAESRAEPPKSERDSLALVRTVSTSNQRSGVAHALDSVLNLSDGGASNLLGALGELSLENMEGYLKSLADLLKSLCHGCLVEISIPHGSGAAKRETCRLQEIPGQLCDFNDAFSIDKAETIVI